MLMKLSTLTAVALFSFGGVAAAQTAEMAVFAVAAEALSVEVDEKANAIAKEETARAEEAAKKRTEQLASMTLDERKSFFEKERAIAKEAEAVAAKEKAAAKAAEKANKAAKAAAAAKERKDQLSKLSAADLKAYLQKEAEIAKRDAEVVRKAAAEKAEKARAYAKEKAEKAAKLAADKKSTKTSKKKKG